MHLLWQDQLISMIVLHLLSDKFQNRDNHNYRRDLRLLRHKSHLDYWGRSRLVPSNSNFQNPSMVPRDNHHSWFSRHHHLRHRYRRYQDLWGGRMQNECDLLHLLDPIISIQVELQVAELLPSFQSLNSCDSWLYPINHEEYHRMGKPCEHGKT